MNAKLKAALAEIPMHDLSSIEFLAVWDALAQYVENSQEAEALEDLSSGEIAKLRAAESILARFDAAKAALTAGK